MRTDFVLREWLVTERINRTGEGDDDPTVLEPLMPEEASGLIFCRDKEGIMSPQAVFILLVLLLDHSFVFALDRGQQSNAGQQAVRPPDIRLPRRLARRHEPCNLHRAGRASGRGRSEAIEPREFRACIQAVAARDAPGLSAFTLAYLLDMRAIADGQSRLAALAAFRR